MTVLSAVNNALMQMGLITAPVTQAIGSNNALLLQTVALMNMMGKQMRDDNDWLELQREWDYSLVEYTVTGDFTAGSATVTNTDTTNLIPNMVVRGEGFGTNQSSASSVRINTIVDATTFTCTQAAENTATGVSVYLGQDMYVPPADYQRATPNTAWDRNYHWEMLGPITPQEWQLRRSGFLVSSVRRRYRMGGVAPARMWIDPVPSAGDFGQPMVLEYSSTNWVIPQQWVTNTSYTTGEFVSNNGYVYVALSTGTSGSTAPTTDSGTQSDGVVTWSYYELPYEDALNDTDIFVIPQRIIELAIKYALKYEKGLVTDGDAAILQNAINANLMNYFPSPDIAFGTQGEYSPVLTQRNLPDTGFGEA